MRTRWLATVTAVAAFLLPGRGLGADAPHDGSFSSADCNNCHLLHEKVDGVSMFTNGCLSCHNGLGWTSFGAPWVSTTDLVQGSEAVPGRGGDNHSWSGYAENPKYGAKMVATNSTKLVGGKLQCTVCHEAHDADIRSDPASMHTSLPVGGTGAVKSGGGTGGTATLQLTAIPANPLPRGYRVQVVSVTPGVGGYVIVSNDGAMASPSWFTYSGGAWVAGTAASAGRQYSINTPVELNTPGVTVTITDGATVGNYWDFYISYPFMATSNADDLACIQCHPERNMTHARAYGTDSNYLPNGVRRFSHAVGMTMAPAAAAAIRDADGHLQSAGDGKATNNLALDGSVVRCTTCHAAHNADSNSLTEDAR